MFSVSALCLCSVRAPHSSTFIHFHLVVSYFSYVYCALSLLFPLFVCLGAIRTRFRCAQGLTCPWTRSGSCGSISRSTRTLEWTGSGRVEPKRAGPINYFVVNSEIVLAFVNGNNSYTIYSCVGTDQGVLLVGEQPSFLLVNLVLAFPKYEYDN